MKLTIALLLAGTVKSQVLLNTLRNLEEADGSNSDGTVSGFGLDLLVDDTINFLQTAGIPIDAAKRKLTYLTNQIKHYKGLEMRIPENASGYDAQVAADLNAKIAVLEDELQHQVDGMLLETAIIQKKAAIKESTNKAAAIKAYQEAVDKVNKQRANYRASIMVDTWQMKMVTANEQIAQCKTDKEKNFEKCMQQSGDMLKEAERMRDEAQSQIEKANNHRAKVFADLSPQTIEKELEKEIPPEIVAYMKAQTEALDKAKKERAKNAAQRDVLDTDAAGNVIGPTANTVDIQINEAGCCQYNANNNKCASWDYKYGKCIPLAHKTIGCIRGFWNHNAKLVSGHCVKY